MIQVEVFIDHTVIFHEVNDIATVQRINTSIDITVIVIVIARSLHCFAYIFR